MLRQSTGTPGLDEMLGGGLLPGTLTVVVGATGIGKTQLGLQYANAGLAAEGQRGVVLDMSVRGDAQGQIDYAKRMFGWEIASADPDNVHLGDDFLERDDFGDYLHVFRRDHRRLTRDGEDFYTWHRWQSELNARLTATIAFFYGNLASGVRRTVIDGVEPVDRPSQSIQIELFEYVYQQILRKEPEWVARDLFRQNYRTMADAAAARQYDVASVGCMLLLTSHETMLDDLIARPIQEGDLLSGANTVLLLGKTRTNDTIGRALHVAKHRGSACDERIAPYVIDDRGLRVLG
jgi:KaiC/GvpD/RAD55 family RecA-like ATPase